MLKERSVVLDLEGFRCRKNKSIVKESLIFLPPASFNSLPKSDQKAYNWLTNNLHGIDWRERFKERVACKSFRGIVVKGAVQSIRFVTNRSELLKTLMLKGKDLRLNRCHGILLRSCIVAGEILLSHGCIPFCQRWLLPLVNCLTTILFIHEYG